MTTKKNGTLKTGNGKERNRWIGEKKKRKREREREFARMFICWLVNETLKKKMLTSPASIHFRETHTATEMASVRSIRIKQCREWRIFTRLVANHWKPDALFRQTDLRKEGKDSGSKIAKGSNLDPILDPFAILFSATKSSHFEGLHSNLFVADGEPEVRTEM